MLSERNRNKEMMKNENATNVSKTTSSQYNPTKGPHETMEKNMNYSTGGTLYNSQIKVFLYEWGIDVSEMNIPSGNVEFEVDLGNK